MGVGVTTAGVAHVYPAAQVDGNVLVDWTDCRRSLSRARGPKRCDVPLGGSFRFGICERIGAFEPHAVNAIGSIEVFHFGWSISNFTSTVTFAVENLEGGAELVKVGPRRLNVVVPFEMSRVVIPLGPGALTLKVYGGPPALLDESRASVGPGSARPALDRDSKYFRVLVALCEPRLRGSCTAAVPSVQEVVQRLRRVPGFAEVNRSSVNYHIDYLRSHKLPVDEQAMSTTGRRMHSKREALVAYALRYDLVCEDDLRLLPGRQLAR